MVIPFLLTCDNMAKKWGEIGWGFWRVFLCYFKWLSWELWFPKRGPSLKTNQYAEPAGQTGGSNWVVPELLHARLVFTWDSRGSYPLQYFRFWFFVCRWRQPNINHLPSLSHHDGFQDTPAQLALNSAECPDTPAPLLWLPLMASFEMSFDPLLFIVLAFNLHILFL